MVNGCSHGTLLHVSPPGSRWSICYYHQDLHRRQLRAGSRPTPSPRTAVPLLLAGACFVGPLVRGKSCIRRSGMGDTLERHPFSGLVASAGELLHTPWRIPTSMATVLLSKATNTFRGIP